MITRRQLAVQVSALNAILSIVTIAALVLGFALHIRLGQGRAGADLMLAILVWSYIAATPLLTAAALILGDRKRGFIRLNYVLLGIWLFAVAWSTTMTM